MQRFVVILWAILVIWLWLTFADNPSILNYSYVEDWDDVKIFRTDNSDGWTIDINLQDPKTNDWLHFGTVEIEDQVFTYTKQWDWDQNIWMIPGDWWDEVKFTIQWTTTINPNATRTVIQAAPKTWPDGNIIWIILATIAIFGGYIYIKKRADI